MERKHGFNLGYLFVALVLIGLFQAWFATRDIAQPSYSDLVRMASEGRIQSVTITETMVEGKFKQPLDGKTFFATHRVDPAAAETFEKAGVEITGASDSNWLTTLLSWILPTVVFLAIWFFFFRRFAEQQGMGGLVTIGKSKAKVYLERKTGVTFQDVAGADEAKAELQEVVSFLKEKDRYSRLGARVPKGVLLVGPPGTGKTLLARAVAGEADVAFFSITGSEFVEMFVGVGAARVRDLFQQARAAAPCIIFIDELDALGRARSALGSFGAGDEKEQTLNQLLAELDGFDPGSGIVLLAATNRPEILDAALLRSGRFDRQIVVDRPDRPGRTAILALHCRKILLSKTVDLDDVARMTPGFTGADLANLVNEAAIFATRRNADCVEMDDFTRAMERIVAGAERRSRLLAAPERERVAIHEMGHAIAAAALRRTDPVQKVSIIPRSVGALGYTLQRPTDDRFLVTAPELLERIVALLAGRAAEELVFSEISTGAADDLAKATDIARGYVTRFGMSRLGQAVLEAPRLQWLDDGRAASMQRDYADATARDVDLAIREILETAYQDARNVLAARIVDLKAGARLLLERETITPADFPAIRREEAAILPVQGQSVASNRP